MVKIWIFLVAILTLIVDSQCQRCLFFRRKVHRASTVSIINNVNVNGNKDASSSINSKSKVRNPFECKTSEITGINERVNKALDAETDITIEDGFKLVENELNIPKENQIEQRGYGYQLNKGKVYCRGKRHKLQIETLISINDAQKNDIEGLSLNFNRAGLIDNKNKDFTIFPFRGVFNSQNSKPYS